MLNKTPITVTEERPIERRGFKRATPFCETSAGSREALMSALLSLAEYSEGDTVTFWGTDVYQTQVRNILIASGHLIRQTNYKRKQTQ